MTRCTVHLADDQELPYPLLPAQFRKRDVPAVLREVPEERGVRRVEDVRHEGDDGGEKVNAAAGMRCRAAPFSSAVWSMQVG